MAELDDVERAIVAIAEDVAEHAKNEQWRIDGIWTEHLLRDLGSLGRSKGFHVRGHYCGDGQSEWLYDQVWLDQDQATRAIIDVPLILESEWSTSLLKIDEDFQKLLLGRAQHRVMVCQRQDVPSVFEKLKEQVRNFKRTKPGDRYLFLGWHYRKDHKEWKTELMVVQ